MNVLQASVTKTSGITSISVTDSHTAPTSTAMITATNTSLSLGDRVSITLGYTGNTNRVFSGYVKSVELKAAERVYTVTCSNAMIRAVDFFIASSNPDQPYTWWGVKAEKLVKDILAMAGLTNYRGANSHFTFGINNPVEVNLTGAYDYAKFISDILAWTVFADDDGKCYFIDRKPYPTSGDKSMATLTNSNISTIQYTVSDRDLRNRVVVYGSEGIYAEAKKASPFLPAGFYKSCVIAAPGIIDSTAVAKQTANYNLAKLNRLTYKCNVTALGNPLLQCRQCVTVSKPDIGVNGKWYIYGIEHSFSKNGYLLNLELRK